MDTTYFGRQYGVMVMFDSLSHQVLSVLEVKYETNALYFSQYQALLKKGIIIQSVIYDGRQGLSRLFGSTPVQLCQFHQVSRVTQYLSRKLKSLAGQELRAITLTLKENNKAAFSAKLEAWYEDHKDYLNERSISPSTGKVGYAHRKLRSAYFSLKRNLERLFTFERYPEFQIPKTTNLLEGLFGDLKQKLRCHQGLKRENKLLFIKDYLSKKQKKNT
ncbi:hypothetical protein A4G20_01780 [Pasteurellaceae bacterium RH1A]|nr:hypothetical protein A4G20_01780 [Pasteurellaceae bacterium RH1A]